MFVHNHDKNHGKLDPRACKCIFLGCASTQKGYKCFDTVSKNMFVTMDVSFFETKSFFESHLQGEKKQEDSTFPNFHNFGFQNLNVQDFDSIQKLNFPDLLQQKKSDLLQQESRLDSLNLNLFQDDFIQIEQISKLILIQTEAISNSKQTNAET